MTRTFFFCSFFYTWRSSKNLCLLDAWPPSQHTLTHARTHALSLLYSHVPYHNDSIIVKTDARRKIDAWRITQEWRTQEDFFTNILPLTLLQGLKRVTQSLQVRGCWRLNINFSSRSSPSTSLIFYRIIYKDNDGWKHKNNHLNYSNKILLKRRPSLYVTLARLIII